MRRFILFVGLAVTLAIPGYAEQLKLNVAHAHQLLDPVTSTPAVSVQLTQESAEDFAIFTGANVQKRIDVAVDGEVMLSPFIQTPLTGGRMQLSGFETAEQAAAFAKNLRLGDVDLTVSTDE
ncbi:hypothetical protein [Devosia sp. Leaf64]|uniref:SecDF P1 head subdomain-containing protein n=1 Tax=Devosia sp. Leaf64 TaxID=1736229 RepID=UPI000786E5F2|nr:hypothetical protein [Devosia sp. Leaf64]